LKLAHNKKSIIEMLTEELGDCVELIYTKEEMLREMIEGEGHEEKQKSKEMNHFEGFTTNEFNHTENLISEIDIEQLPVIEEIDVIVALEEKQPVHDKKEHFTHEMISLKRPPKKKRNKTKLNKENVIPSKIEPTQSVEPVKQEESYTNAVMHKTEPITTKPWIAPSCFVPLRS